ncbi:hypothetical protein Bbelb_219760 [Branchiostoma belcheri]|nr:hypothetical protein Bbelb_219760 [Branchiostoma belcheri]
MRWVSNAIVESADARLFTEGLENTCVHPGRNLRMTDLVVAGPPGEMADTRMLAVVVMMITVVSMTVDAVYHKEQQREEVILHVDQQASYQEGTKFKNPEPVTGLQESPTPNKRIGEEVIVDQEGLNTFVRIISLLPIPSYLQMRTIHTGKSDFNVSRIPRVIRFADCSSSCEDTPQIVAFPFNQDGMADHGTRMLTVALAVLFGAVTVVCAACRGEGQEEEIVDEEGLKSLEPFFRLNAERIPHIHAIEERTIPKWKYEVDSDGSRIPSGINYANCSSSRCKRGYEVHPVYAPQVVACAFTDEDGMRKYSVQKQQFAVACICVRSKITEDKRRRGRKKKEERGVLSTRTRRPRRRGRGQRKHAPGGTE